MDYGIDTTRAYRKDIMVNMALAFAMSFCLVAALPDFLTWASSGFNRDALAIESCLNNGGRWADDARACAYD